MSSIKILPIATQSDLKRFIHFPYGLYRDDKCYVPPLRGDVKKQLTRHPFHDHAESLRFLAVKNGRVVGRIAAIIDQNHNRFHEENAGFFGYFECVEDDDVGQALLSQAKETLFNKGVSIIYGPASPSSNGEFGLLIDGFKLRPSLMMPYHKPYYRAMIEAAGFEKAKDLLAFDVHQDNLDPKVMALLKKIHQRRSRDAPVTIRTVALKRFQEELSLLRDLYNNAWEKNWGFVPMTGAEFDFEAEDLRRIIDPRIVLVAELEGQPVGFILMVPDYNEALCHCKGRLFPLGIFKLLYHARKIKRTRTILLGVTPEHRDRGLAAMLYFEGIRRGIESGYEVSECSWILEDNQDMCKAIERIGGELTKVYRVYECKR